MEYKETIHGQKPLEFIRISMVFVFILTENGGASIIKYKLKLKATEYLLPHEF